MRIKHCLAVVSYLLLIVCAPLSARDTGSVETRLAGQNTLFDEYYETQLKTHPELATSFGDYRYNDQLNDYSLEGAKAQEERDQAYLARLKAIQIAGFTEQDRLSHEVLERLLEQRVADYG